MSTMFNESQQRASLYLNNEDSEVHSIKNGFQNGSEVNASRVVIIKPEELDLLFSDGEKLTTETTDDNQERCQPVKARSEYLSSTDNMCHLHPAHGMNVEVSPSASINLEVSFLGYFISINAWHKLDLINVGLFVSVCFCSFAIPVTCI